MSLNPKETTVPTMLSASAGKGGAIWKESSAENCNHLHPYLQWIMVKKGELVKKIVMIKYQIYMQQQNGNANAYRYYELVEWRSLLSLSRSTREL